MKVALAQMDIEWESKAANYVRAEQFVKMASERGCDIVVFPEMFNTGFSMNLPFILEEENGPTSTLLSGLAKKYRVNLIAGFPVRAKDGQKGLNMAAVYDREGIVLTRFVKLHPFSFAKENEYYEAGRGTVLFKIKGMPASIFICYDLRFPEVMRAVARDVQAIFVIANWPTSRKDHWVALLKARAIENQCFVIGVNRAGTDGNGINYPGASHVFGPSGNVVLAGEEAEDLLIAEFDPEEVSRVRSAFPFLEDMRQGVL